MEQIYERREQAGLFIVNNLSYIPSSIYLGELLHEGSSNFTILNHNKHHCLENARVALCKRGNLFGMSQQLDEGFLFPGFAQM